MNHKTHRLILLLALIAQSFVLTIAAIVHHRDQEFIKALETKCATELYQGVASTVQGFMDCAQARQQSHPDRGVSLDPDFMKLWLQTTCQRFNQNAGTNGDKMEIQIVIPYLPKS